MGVRLEQLMVVSFLALGWFRERIYWLGGERGSGDISGLRLWVGREMETVGYEFGSLVIHTN